LIREGWLSRIIIRSVPAGIDLTQVRTVAGDYREDDLGQAIEPHLLRCAEISPNTRRADGRWSSCR
jgi:hypothetical protein